MTDIELEEGEAYFYQDDDENQSIDPDKDFSYIDKKIENVLGHYQKDFMGGLSAESLGARFGGYGSFLPKQQRSPPILSNQRSQSHVSSKSPQDLPLEHLHQNPAISANHPVATRLIPALGDQNAEAFSESGISSTNNKLKNQSAGEQASVQQKKRVMMHPEKNTLKFRVKMASENIYRLDKSAIYSGLGLDMSPTSSPEGSASENDGTSTGLQETNLESPSVILKIMMTMPLSSNDLLSPLHNSLVYLKGMEENLETGLPGIGEAYSVNTVPENMYTKGKKEGRKERKSKVKDANKVKKSKRKEASEERLSKQKAQSRMSVELMKENREYPENIVALSATRRREEDGASNSKEVVSNASINAVVACAEEKEHASMSKNMGSNPTTVFDKRNEVGCLGEDTDNLMKQVHVAKKKAKEGSSSAKNHDVVENEMNATTLRKKTEKESKFNFIPKSESSTENMDEMGWIEGEVNKPSKQRIISKDKVKEDFLESAHSKDKNTTLVPKSEPITEKRNEGRKENVLNKFLKPQGMSKDKVKEEVLDSPCSVGNALYRKENIVEKNLKDEALCFLSPKGEKNDNYNGVSQKMKFDNVEALDPLMQKSHVKGMAPLAEPALCNEKENMSSVVKKNLKGSRIGGMSAVEPPKGSLIGRSSAANKEGVLSRTKSPAKSRKGDTDLSRKMRKNVEVVAGKGNYRKRGKEVSSKDLAIGVAEPEAPGFTAKPKEKFHSSKPGLASNIGSNMEGNLAGVYSMTEKVGNMPPVENAQLVTTLEDWVECERCHKWRLLPLGTSADSLTEKIWTCRMITWLPGMNKCSYSEDETTDALRALYVPLDPAMAQNNQPAYLDANAANVSSDALNVFPPNQATGFDALPSGNKRKNLVKTEIDASRQTGIQELHIPVKKEPQHFGEMKNSKNLKKLPQEPNSGRKSGDGKMSKTERKRVADFEPFVVTKKMKIGHQQPVEDYVPGPSLVSQDLTKVCSKYPILKDKNRNQSYMTSMDEEMYNDSRKKRKLKDKQHSVALTSGKGGHLVKNCDVGGVGPRKKKKTKSSNFQARESNADKRCQRTQMDDPVSNLGDVRDSSLHQGGRSVDMPMEQYSGNRVSGKTPGGKVSSEMALDVGLPDNAATSSSSMISRKVKPKVQGVKSSSVVSIPISPSKALTSDPDKGTNKKFASHYEQRLKSGAESGANEFTPHSEGFRDRKSKLSKNYVSDAADEDLLGKEVPTERHPNSHAIDIQTKLEDRKGADGKLEPAYEGISTSQQNLVTESQMKKSPLKLPFDGTNSDKGKSRLPKTDSEKEVSSNSHGVPDFDGGSGFVGGRVDNINGMPSKQIVARHVSLRQWHNTGHASNDIEASGSRKKDNVPGAAKTALREAKDLKHSAYRLKVAGSGLESTGIFFQAALKFLHGASLLESGNTGEMTPNEVYASTAKLCEYCAQEYERCNDMASAALAYKCMEVAYMRVVYCNDLAATRDRQELQMAVRAAPQVDSPSSSASDIDNLNQAAIDTVKDGHSTMDHQSHIVSAGNRPNFMRLLDFTLDINCAMAASRKSQGAFAAAMPVYSQARNEEGILSIKSVLNFSFHDIDGFLHLVRLAMESIKS